MLKKSLIASVDKFTEGRLFMNAIAHKYRDGSIQLLSDHLRNVKEKSAEFASAASLDVLKSWENRILPLIKS